VDENIETVVSILEDDAVRGGGTVTNDRLLHLASKFDLAPDAIISVKRRLQERDVPLEMSEGDDLQRDVPTDELEKGPDAESLEKNRDIVATYFRESARYKLLTRDQELALARRIHAGASAQSQITVAPPEAKADLKTLIEDGIDAREDLIQANLRLVPFVAKQLDMAFTTQEDLIQEGNLGLLRAADRFDGEHGTRFATYAYWWIWSFMMRANGDRNRLVRVPVHIHERIPRLLRAQRALSRERDGAPVMPQDLAEVLGWDIKTVQLVLLAHASDTVSIDGGTNDDAPTLGDRLTAAEASPETTTSNRQRGRLIRSLIASLDERLAHIITERFGLKDGIDRTLEEIGVQMGVTRERIRQLEKKALDKLRHPSRIRIVREIFGLNRDSKDSRDDQQTTDEPVPTKDSNDGDE
jgi:RNA polymerase sigma factor (sigma-70 family)